MLAESTMVNGQMYDTVQNQPKREEDDYFDTKEFRDWTSGREFLLHAAVEQHEAVEGPLHELNHRKLVQSIIFYRIYSYI